MELEIDNGARCSVISKTIAQRFTSIASVCESGTVINGVCGNQTKVHGQITLPCKYGSVSLLGRSDCLRCGLIMQVNTVNSVSISIKELIQEFSDVVGDSIAIGYLPGEYEIKVDDLVEPVIHAPRPLPVAMRDDVKK